VTRMVVHDSEHRHFRPCCLSAAVETKTRAHWYNGWNSLLRPRNRVANLSARSIEIVPLYSAWDSAECCRARMFGPIDRLSRRPLVPPELSRPLPAANLLSFPNRSVHQEGTCASAPARDVRIRISMRVPLCVRARTRALMRAYTRAFVLAFVRILARACARLRPCACVRAYARACMPAHGVRAILLHGTAPC
jgi:hypothetical protein